jgi:hypothetical protein
MRLKSLAALLCAAILFLIVPPGCDDVGADLQVTLEKYIDAERRADGEAMLKIIDPKNVEYYDNLVNLARTGRAEEIMHRPRIDKYWVGVIRAGTTAKELKALDGRGVVRKWVAAPDEEEEGKPPEFTLRNVKHREPRATGELVVDGTPTAITMEFVHVGEEWLVNDEAFNTYFNELTGKIMKFWNRSEEAVLLMMISDTVGKNVQIGVWGDPGSR